MVPEQTEVLIIGGGPAGSLLACMLARRGVDVVLAEKQATLERTFRGETLVSASVTSLRALGFGPALEAHGYLETRGIRMYLEGRHVMDLEYERTKTRARHVDMPQPALLRIINESASREPSYTYLAGATMVELDEESGTVTGAKLRLRDGSETVIRARLVVGADGRFSRVRKQAGLEAKITPMDRDVLWVKVPRPEGWSQYAEFFVDRQRHVVSMPTFPNDLRVAHNLPKRGYSAVKKAGLDAFKAGITELDPRLGPLLDQSVKSWEDTSFLEIFTAELDTWARDGLVLIGDASHTCTPILGQGINLSVQDCVRITPIIAAALKSGTKPLSASTFSGFVAERRKHKDLVTRFQTMQEEGLVVSNRRELLTRKLRYRVLGALPLRYWIIDKVLNGEVIDPIDVRDHTAAAAITGRAA
ncbi:NAD(P)-binding protein [Nocardia sp. SYP-A9097]|uniref:FAD-dependent oxidoreductase n=1 Tax=Nocardia sp. SYP-A9097 TaxID=2663237 RepID=UPI00129BFBAC|nr:FAD-dependent oxidoreductase [Nocardia sp. SYP-A9097]MRH92365.1 NAD(P)-binding protein [Nocardia sp. SYP-A9097]